MNDPPSRLGCVSRSARPIEGPVRSPAIRLLLPLLLGGVSCATGEPGRPATGRESAPVRVEAESPRGRRSESGSFARRFEDRWASGRACLVGFNDPGRVTYALEVPAAGEWVLWLRYAAVRDVEVPFGLGGLDAELAPRPLAGTGGLEGKHAWAWAELHRGPLEPGELLVCLGGAPIRPDALLLAPASAGPPTVSVRPVPEYDEAARALLARPLVPVRPAWIAGNAGWRAPAWYEDARVSAHTRLSPVWRERPTFVEAEELLASLGVTTYVRHVRTRGEGAWWPSAVGESEPWASEEPVRGMVERAHARDLRLVGYYRHLEDAGAGERHPDWACRDDLGRVRRGRRGPPEMCLNSPYAEELLTRLEELAERGVDGIYFDEHHYPREGCFCAWCRALWTEHTELPFPETADDEDPLCRKLQELADLTLEHFFRRARERLKARHPELVLLIGNNRYPDLFDRHTSTRLARLADGVKTEYGKGESQAVRGFFQGRPELWEPPRATRLALGWTLCRDAADGRPPHVWINGLRTAAEARAATAAVVAWGGIANLDAKEDALPEREVLAPAVELVAGLRTALSGARPVRLAAVHFPEAARDATADDAGAWDSVLAPLFGAWHELLRARVPAGLVTDSQLEGGELAGLRLLFLPAPDRLTGAMRAAVEAFAADGGLVVEARPGQDWGSRAGHAAAAEAFRSALEPLLAELPVRVLGGPPTLQVTLHEDPKGRRVLCLANDPAWVWTERRELPGGKPIELPAGIDVPPGPVEGVRLLVRGRAEPLEIPAFDALAWRQLDP